MFVYFCHLRFSFSVPLLSSIGRALLQLGDVKAAQQRFAQAERVAGKDPTFNVQLTMNRYWCVLLLETPDAVMRRCVLEKDI